MSTHNSLAPKPNSAQAIRVHIYFLITIIAIAATLCVPAFHTDKLGSKTTELINKDIIWVDNLPEKYALAKTNYMQSLKNERLNPVTNEIIAQENIQETFNSQTSLWQTIAEDDDIQEDSDDAIDKQLVNLVDNSFWIQKNLAMAKPYLKYVVDQLESRNLPLSLALIPIIESNYNPNAKSQNNAVGMWQFIPHTGEALGLKINRWVDERKSIDRSTQAALDYFEQLHDKLGSWPMAIAAYNAGPSRINSTLKKVAAGTRIWELKLPKETRNYVAKFYALKILIARQTEIPEFDLPEIEDVHVFKYIELKNRVSLFKAAQLAGVSVEELKKYNNELLVQSTPPEGPHKLAVPVKIAADFEQRVNYAESKSISLYEPVVYYFVKPGDILGGIAIKFNTTISALKQLNEIADSKIKVGQKIKVYSRIESDDTTTIDPPPKYKVKKGDTLSTIAQRFGVKRSTLVKNNQIDNANHVRTGKVLVIPAKFSPDDYDDYISYVVKAGDSLSTIAEKFDVQLSGLKQINPPIATANTLFIGQTLKIPIRKLH